MSYRIGCSILYPADLKRRLRNYCIIDCVLNKFSVYLSYKMAETASGLLQQPQPVK